MLACASSRCLALQGRPLAARAQAPSPVCRAAQAAADAPVVPADTTQPGPRRAGVKGVLFRLAAVVEVQDQVRRYEEFAGRSAMVGFAVALASELITEKGVFFSVAGENAAALATGTAAVLALAALLAVARNNASAADGQSLLEAVYASLTAVRRSASSITQAQVDKAVDHVLEELDGVRMLSTLLEDEWI